MGEFRVTDEPLEQFGLELEFAGAVAHARRHRLTLLLCHRVQRMAEVQDRHAYFFQHVHRKFFAVGRGRLIETDLRNESVAGGSKKFCKSQNGVSNSVARVHDQNMCAVKGKPRQFQ